MGNEVRKCDLLKFDRNNGKAYFLNSKKCLNVVAHRDLGGLVQGIQKFSTR